MDLTLSDSDEDDCVVRQSDTNNTNSLSNNGSSKGSTGTPVITNGRSRAH